MHAIDVLLERLAAKMRLHQSASQEILLRLEHRCAPAEVVRVGLLRPSNDLRHLRELIGLHVSALLISEPLITIVLETELIQASRDDRKDLFGQRIDPGQQFIELVERLRVRLGFPAVHGVSAAADNRPEHAWHVVADLQEKSRLSAAGFRTGIPGSRPLWLFPAPRRLRILGGRPFFQGELEMESGPERIETGWWNGSDVRRDYYVTANSRGMRLWVFRDYRQGGWYLHGLFG
jgi:protein ImuB